MPELYHPYRDLTGGAWLRGNLHTHTNRSDGQRPLQDVVADYADRGYDFLMISDHDLYTGAEIYGQIDNHGMVLIPGNEISANGPHMLHVDADRLVTPCPQRQQVLQEIEAGRGFALINHPNWQQRFDHCTIEQLSEWLGYSGLEIYNGVIGRLDGSPYATNKWDMLLAQGRQVWGFANDDSHTSQDVELGWNTVYAPQRDCEHIVRSLVAGRFYASTGVGLRSIVVEGMRIRIESDNAQRIVALREVGRRFAIADGPCLEVEAPADARYIRFELWGPGEKRAWTQPFFTSPR